MLDEGHVAEFDVPYILLQKRDSQLRKLVEQTGKSETAQLLDIAKKAFEKRKSDGKVEVGLEEIDPVIINQQHSIPDNISEVVEEENGDDDVRTEITSKPTKEETSLEQQEEANVNDKEPKSDEKDQKDLEKGPASENDQLSPVADNEDGSTSLDKTKQEDVGESDEPTHVSESTETSTLLDKVHHEVDTISKDDDDEEGRREDEDEGQESQSLLKKVS